MAVSHSQILNDTCRKYKRKDMKRIAKLTLATALVTVMLGACQNTKEEPLYYEDGIVNLEGPWSPEQMAYTDEQSPFVASASLTQD